MFYFVTLVILTQTIYATAWIIQNNGAGVISRHELNQLIQFEDSIESFNEENMQQKFAFIYPGTKWCGTGNVANNMHDLGSEWKADKCCREHDYCPDIISAGETKYNLTNEAFYTRLACDCDEAFRKCLLASNTTTADNVGMFYFNALGTKCYRKDYPKRQCIKKGGWLNKKCLVYTYDKSSEKVFQWFDVNNYR